MLMGVYIDSNHAIYFYFSSGFSITHSKGETCTTLCPFESKDYSIGKKLHGLDWEKAF